MAELKARATELEKQLEQSASEVRDAESKYSPLFDGAQTLKQRTVTGVSCNVEMERCLIGASKDVLGYMDVLHSKAVNSQNTVGESCCGCFVSFVQRI